MYLTSDLPGITEVLERKRTQMLQYCRRSPSLNKHLQHKNGVSFDLTITTKTALTNFTNPNSFTRTETKGSHYQPGYHCLKQ